MNRTTAIEGDATRPVAALKTVLPAALCVVSGFLCAFTVSFVGQIPVGELVLAMVFLWVLLRSIVNRGWPTRMQQLGWYKALITLVAVMAVGYVASDLYRGTSGENLARGWARVGFLGIDLVAIAYLVDGSWARLQATVFALYVGGSVNAALTGPLFEKWWEFGIGYTVTAFVLFICAGRATVIQVTAALAMAAVSFSQGARSLGGICILVAVLFGLRHARGIIRPLAFLVAAGALASLLLTANSVILQNLGKEGSTIERRSMIETAGEAFISSPFIGQGSWFTSSRKMLAQLEERRERLDPKFHGYSDDQGRQLSIHSQLMVALAEGGILGGSFFIFYGALLLKTLRSLTRNPVPHRAFVLYLVIAGIWNLCMSPFSGVARTEICLAICACLLAIMQRQGELPENFSE
ncbi:MAG TPA: hypothetical protein VKG78_04645 [Opitutaceae bacterium]|nr:hypothetical protein [Opitutaceae bacterium]